jgi:chromosome partitioning protein
VSRDARPEVPEGVVGTLRAMARVVAVANQKGGVGKTTTVHTLGVALARAGSRVLLVDLDPQACLTYSVGLDPESLPLSLHDVLVGRNKAVDAIVVAGDVSVLPAAIDLAGSEVHLVGRVGREHAVGRALEPVKDSYDVVLVDCPPSLGILTINALAAVDDVFLPLQPHFLALHGLSKLLKTIGLVNNRLNPRLSLAGVVLCLYESGTKLAAEVSRDVEQFFKEARKGNPAWSNVRLFEARIRRNIRLAESPSFGQSIFQYAAGSPGAEDYRALGGEVLAYYAGRLMLEAAAA